MPELLMNELPGCGVEHGIDWCLEQLLRDNLTPADLESAFEDCVADCYGDTVKIGWIETDVVTAVKSLDPISWDIAKQEYILCRIRHKVYSAFAISQDTGSIDLIALNRLIVFYDLSLW